MRWVWFFIYKNIDDVFMISAPKLTYSEILRNPIHLKAGGVLYLEVDVNGYPQPKVLWYLGEKELNTTKNCLIEEGQEWCSLKVKAITAADSGKYRVTAENSAGMDIAEFTAVIKSKDLIHPKSYTSATAQIYFVIIDYSTIVTALLCTSGVNSNCVDTFKTCSLILRCCVIGRFSNNRVRLCAGTFPQRCTPTHVPGCSGARRAARRRGARGVEDVRGHRLADASERRRRHHHRLPGGEEHVGRDVRQRRLHARLRQRAEGDEAVRGQRVPVPRAGGERDRDGTAGGDQQGRRRQAALW